MKFVNESIEENSLSEDQKFLVDFLKSKGLVFKSSPLQIKNGTLIFEDPEKVKWGIFSAGYVRKWITPSYDPSGRWQVIAKFPPNDFQEAMNIFSKRFNKIKSTVKTDYKETYVKRIMSALSLSLKEYSRKEQVEVIKELYKIWIDKSPQTLSNSDALDSANYEISYQLSHNGPIPFSNNKYFFNAHRSDVVEAVKRLYDKYIPKNTDEFNG
jgi:hypothetical protein